MTREEEKKKARWEYVSKRLAIPDFPTYNAEYELEAAFDAGAKWADRTMIEKVCDLLRDLDVFTEDFINDFRKAMEGGEQ